MVHSSLMVRSLSTQFASCADAISGDTGATASVVAGAAASGATVVATGATATAATDDPS